jgi:hypothetical protein
LICKIVFTVKMSLCEGVCTSNPKYGGIRWCFTRSVCNHIQSYTDHADGSK